MRLTSVQIYACDLPLKNPPYRMGGNSVNALQSTIVKAIFDEQFIGWGEACPLGSVYQEDHATGVQAAMQYLCGQLIGETFTSLRQWDNRLNNIMAGHSAAKMALSIAFADALGKKEGQPLAAIIGQPQTTKIPSYYALGIMRVEDSVNLAMAKVKQGFKRLQIKIGGRDLMTDIAVLHELAATLPDSIELIADANRSLSMADALHLSRQCESLPITLEQPCASVEEHRQIAGRLCHPLILDENTTGLQRTMDIIEQSLVSGFGIKLTRFAGLTDFIKLRQLCETHKLRITCDDTFGGDIITAACIHTGATINPQLFAGTWTALDLIDHRYNRQDNLTINNGRLAVPAGTGLGIEPKDDLIGSVVFAI